MMTSFLASEGQDPEETGEAATRDEASQENATFVDKSVTKRETADEERKTIIGKSPARDMETAIQILDPRERARWLRRNPSVEAIFSLAHVEEFYFCSEHGIFLLWPGDTLQCTGLCMFTTDDWDWTKNPSFSRTDRDDRHPMAGDERIWAAYTNPSEPYDSDRSSTF